MKTLVTAIIISLGTTAALLAQGSMFPPGNPMPTQKSLQQIWDKIGEVQTNVTNTTSQVTALQTELSNVKSELAALKAPALAQQTPAGMVLVVGGTLPAESPYTNASVSTFYIAKTEVTVAEWFAVVEYATNRGYAHLADYLSGNTNSNHLPAMPQMMNVAAIWCNAKSEMAGLRPVYLTKSNAVATNATHWESAEHVSKVDSSANGYRLPSGQEWYWAARGGVAGQGYKYSGSYDLDAVGWYNGNYSGGVQPVAQKAANELGIYDMSGNAAEWCWEKNQWGGDLICGGAYSSSNNACAIGYRDFYSYPSSANGFVGFRYVRDAGK